MILNERDSRHETALQIGKQMMIAARTAPKAKGVDIKGAKYPLKNAKLEKSMPSFAISNEVAESFAMVSVKKGGLFVIESKELSK